MTPALARVRLTGHYREDARYPAAMVNVTNRCNLSCAHCFVGEHMSLDGIVACLEKNLIRHALQQSNGNRTQAAAVLKISPSTLRDKLKKYRTDDSRESVD